MVLSPSLGETLADAGVAGLVAGCGDGKGREDVLSLASSDFISRADALFVSMGVFDLATGAADTESVTIRGVLEERSLDGSLEPLGSGALKVLPVSRVRLDREFAELTVCAREGLVFALVSTAGSIVTGWGLRACATARGPAHLGNMGKATLARTKLESTVTGSTFSLIFSWRAVSATPKTMCWTLL